MSNEEEDDELDDIFYGDCDRCGCNLTDPSEALDGVCDQCQWWISQCEENRP